jgi:hypothetical protein
MKIDQVEQIIENNLFSMWECIGDPDLEHFYRGVIKCIIEEYAEERMREFKRKHRAINKVKWL